jgi:hypothetical protein
VHARKGQPHRKLNSRHLQRRLCLGAKRRTTVLAGLDVANPDGLNDTISRMPQGEGGR